MAKRYNLTGIRRSDKKFVSKHSKTTVQHYDTTVYTDVPKSNDDIYVITQYGDRLDNLAYEYYGDQHLWWFIARVNHINTMNLTAGTRLRIPVSTTTATGD